MKEEPMIIKPKYNYIYELLNRNGLTTAALLFLLLIMLRTPAVKVYIVILILYVIYVIASMIYRIKKYKVSQYLFFSDRLEYRNKFKDKENKVIQYKDIVQVGYKETFFQKYFNMGDLLLIMKRENVFRPRLYIWSVEKARQQYDKVQQLIATSREK